MRTNFHPTAVQHLEPLLQCEKLRALNLAGNPCAPSPPPGFFFDAGMGVRRGVEGDGEGGGGEEGEGVGEGGAGGGRAYREYRAAVLGMCRNLRILDGKKVVENERACEVPAHVRRRANDREVFIYNMPWGMSEVRFVRCPCLALAAVCMPWRSGVWLPHVCVCVCV